MELTNEQVKQKKIILLKTMKIFISLCNEYNLRYYAGYGTCLGAIRHKGMIPWDDDIDVIMPRVDYEKLLLLKKVIKEKDCEIKDYNDEKYYLSYAKFMDAHSTILESPEHTCPLGVFIDVFPLDEVGNVKRAKCYSDKKKDIFAKYQTSVLSYKTKDIYDALISLNIKKTAILIRNKYFRSILRKVFYKRLLKLENQIKKESGDSYMFYGGVYAFDKELIMKEWLGDGTEMPFEDFTINVPQNYKKYLMHLYGNYMTPPPPEKRVSHHYTYFVDLNKRWYIKDIRKLNLERQDLFNYDYE